MLKSFTFHEGWKDVLSRLPAKVRLEVYDAIMEYGLSGTLTKLKATAELAFAILKNDIDADNHRAESIRRKRSAAGKRHKGNQYSSNGTNGTSVPTEWNKCSKKPLNKGVPKDLKNGTSVPNGVLQESTLSPLDEETPPETPIEVKPPISPKENPRPKRARKVFVKPTVEEMRSYITEKGYALDAQQIFDRYEMVGWVYGKSHTPIKDWKAAIRTWVTNDKRYNNNGTTQTNQGPGQVSDHPSDSELHEQSVRIMQRFEAERNARQAAVRQGGGFSHEGKP